MNYSQIVKAFPALAELKKLRLPYAKARDIHKAHKALESEFQFFAAEEAKLINEFAAKGENGTPQIADGRITFANAETKSKYIARITELETTEADVEIPCVTLTGAEIGDELISAKTIEALECIITFE